MAELPEYFRISRPYRDYSFSSAAIISVTYWIICLTVAGLVIFSWCFVVEVSTLSPGIIRPFAETTDIRAASGGQIKKSFIRENQFVQAGDTLYVFVTDALMIRKTYLSDKVRETEQIIDDLKMLTSGIKKKLPQTLVFQQSWTTFLQKMSEANTRLKKAQTDYKRNAKLHSQSVIANADIEAYKFELDRATNEVVLTRKVQEHQWQNELVNYEREMRGLQSELAEVNREMSSMVILSPITGTVRRNEGIYPGSIVYANQDLAQVSPDTDLIVETYVSPRHIGLLRTGMKVRFLIDAFNYNQWGFGEGTVLDISNDIHLVNDVPVFKVRCSLNRNYLELKNGYKGILKKGMSLKARFVVTERTLWQLLYDKTDDWLNPGK